MDLNVLFKWSVVNKSWFFRWKSWVLWKSWEIMGFVKSMGFVTGLWRLSTSCPVRTLYFVFKMMDFVLQTMNFIQVRFGSSCCCTPYTAVRPPAVSFPQDWYTCRAIDRSDWDYVWFCRFDHEQGGLIWAGIHGCGWKRCAILYSNDDSCIKQWWIAH